MEDFDFFDLMELIDKFGLDVDHLCDLPDNSDKDFQLRIVFQREEICKQNTNENITAFCNALEKVGIKTERGTAHYRYCPNWIYNTVLV